MSQYQKGKTNLDFTEARDSWAICKSAPRSRQITMPAPHHSVFYRPDALLAAQPTVSEQFCSAFCSAFEKIIKTYLFTVTGALDVLSDTE